MFGLHVIVQSDHKDPEYLDDRVESFLKDYRETLSSMPSEEFSHYIQAVIEDLLEKPKNLDEVKIYSFLIFLLHSLRLHAGSGSVLGRNQEWSLFI
jgi:secreted Zn-dependent insulinase-like peptidase